MSEEFATGLLNQGDLLKTHTDGALVATGELAAFVKKLAKLEAKFGQELSALVAKDGKKLLEREPLHGTVREFTTVFMSQLVDVAKSHAQYSETLHSAVVASLDQFAKEAGKRRAATAQDAQKTDKAWKTQLDKLRKAEAHYRDAAAHADAAHDAFAAGKADADMKPKELTSLSAKAQKAADKRDKQQAEYKRVLNVTNQAKTVYWCQDVPAVLRRYQAHEEERVSRTKQIVEALGHAFLFKPPVYQSAAEALIRASDAISPDADTAALIKKHGTSFSAPGDYPESKFGGEHGTTTLGVEAAIADENSGVASSSSGGGRQRAGAAEALAKGGPPPLPSKGDKKGKPLDGGRDVLSKCTGLAGLDASLNDLDKYSAIEAQLSDVEKAHQHERNAKKGLEALVGFYKDDPVAKHKAEAEIAESSNKLDALKQRMDQLRAERDSLAPDAQGRIRSYTHTAVPPVQGETEDELPTLCTATAAFDYEATNDQELSFKAGDVLLIKTKDESGWWWAELNGVQNFVPATYVDVHEEE